MIIYRKNKGAPLTIEEMDNNFMYLEHCILTLQSQLQQMNETISMLHTTKTNIVQDIAVLTTVDQYTQTTSTETDATSLQKPNAIILTDD